MSLCKYCSKSTVFEEYSKSICFACGREQEYIVLVNKNDDTSGVMLGRMDSKAYNDAYQSTIWKKNQFSIVKSTIIII